MDSAVSLPFASFHAVPHSQVSSDAEEESIASIGGDFVDDLPLLKGENITKVTVSPTIMEVENG